MSGTAPPWNARDRSGSLCRLAEWLNDTARQTLLEDGFHTELFFLYRADGRGVISQPPPGLDRDQVAEALRQTIRVNNIYGLVHICEAWTYFPKLPRDHTMTQILHGEIAVSELRPEDRTEALTVRMESRDGASRLWMSPIVRTTRGVALSDAVEWPEPPDGRFAGLFGG